MDRESITHKFAKLTVWKRAGERAPHKPLLILYAIGKLLRGESRLVSYSEVDKNLGALLKEFGPKRANYRTQYPFWRLQNDEVWEVQDTEKITLTTSGDPKKGDLIRHNVSGGFPDDIFVQLQKDPKLASDIIQVLLDSHFPSSLHRDILQSVGIETSTQIFKRRKRDLNFRENVLKAYEYKCAICGFDVKLGHYPIALEAAHIKWHQAGGPETEVNGLALCVLHHKLFDRGAFTLSERLEILVSDLANGSIGFQEWLMNFHGKQINFPQRKSYYPEESFVGWHIREVFQGEYREL